MSDSDHIIATIPTGRRGEELRVVLTTYKGHHYLALRIWYLDDHDEMRPSSKGLNVKLGLLPQIAEALNDALAQARADGLVT